MHLRLAASLALVAAAASAQESGAKIWTSLCAGCHAADASGTDRGPGLLNNRGLRRRGPAEIASLIRTGTPGGMPGFPLPEAQMAALTAHVRAYNATALEAQPPGDPAAGRAFFFGAGNCSGCHMVRGEGGINGPDLSDVGKQLTVLEIEKMLDDPSGQSGVRPTASCPGWAHCPADQWAVVRVDLKAGGSVRGFARNRGKHDIQLQTLDGQWRLLNASEYTAVTREPGALMPALKSTPAQRRDLIAYLSRLDGIPVGAASGRFPEPTSAQINALLKPGAGEWPTYSGNYSANRHSPLKQIDTSNVARLEPKWSYTLPYFGLQTTPLVSEGVMYVTGPNQVCALDAATGRQIWCWTRRRSDSSTISGDAAKGAQRGAALLGDRVFFATDDAHLVAIHRITGALLWDVNMVESPGAFGATAAPLVVGDLVISGIGGGDAPLRGFLAAYKVTTGEQAWRFWTIPKRGEKGSETWQGTAIETGGGATWLTGSYDPQLDTLYWPTGNPFPDTDGTERKGDNLYTNSVVALEPRTGKLKWYFQFTPHDLHDWDATEPLVLVDTKFQGRDRKLLLQANRSGFYYVLDRTNGQFLLGTPFVKRLTWAKGIGADGRPQLAEGNAPTRAGVVGCPAVRGATNWYSTAFHPDTRLFYVMAVEDCNIYRQAGLGGYVPYRDPANPPEKYLRALDFETGKVVWEIPQVGAPEANYSGVLSTAGGLVFYGETGGDFAAVDARTGKSLWHFPTGQEWKASPMTYMVKGRQYVAIAAGSTVLSFALETAAQ